MGRIHTKSSSSNHWCWRYFLAWSYQQSILEYIVARDSCYWTDCRCGFRTVADLRLSQYSPAFSSPRTNGCMRFCLRFTQLCWQAPPSFGLRNGIPLLAQRRLCAENQLKVVLGRGFVPKLWNASFWRMLATGRVDDHFAFKFTRHTLMGYLGLAIKQPIVYCSARA
jgi:hypothetical protein